MTPSLLTIRAGPALVVLVACSSPIRAQNLSYPNTPKSSQIDDYHGVNVADPYRWLENDTASAVRRWVGAQNAVTFAYLERIRFRDALRSRMEQLHDYPRYSAPMRVGQYYIFAKNDGLQDQFVFYRQRGLNGPSEVLIDPNTLSSDGTVGLWSPSPSRDGVYFGYGVLHGGSDWMEYRVMDIETRRVLADRVQWIKGTDISWYGNGFFYSRYPAPSDTTQAFSEINEHHRVFYHRVGTLQEQDQLVFEDPAHPRRRHTVWVTDDERFLVLFISDLGTPGRGGNELWIRDLARGDATFWPLVRGFEYSHFVVDNVGDKLLVYTNRHATNWRVVEIDPARPEEAHWREILPEAAQPLDNVSVVGGRLFARYLRDATHTAVVYDLQGNVEREISLPTVGRIGWFNTQKEASEIFVTFSSFTYPPAVLRYDIPTGEVTVWRQSEVPFDPAAFGTRQVFYTSRDGTRVPMFITHRKGLSLDGRRPTVLSGYGGFGSTQSPHFDPLLVALLEQGAVYAVANVRGGGEYGEDWHRAGMLLNKRNAFDDFIAAAEWLQANGYTTHDRCAIQGHSNGALLVGVVMTQRPDLCSVALPSAGLMDMLRYHRFTVGWSWAAEYGSSDDSVHFSNLLTYSPYHNVKDGATYPATLITTADHDDRVVPAHSFKFAARLQEAHRGVNPILIRVETRSGHTPVSTSKLLDERTDVYAFFLYNVGVTPQYEETPSSNRSRRRGFRTETSRSGR